MIKKLIPASAVVLAIVSGFVPQSPAQNVQYATLSVTNSFAATMAVQTNQVVLLVGYDWTTHPSIYGQTPAGNLALTPYTGVSGVQSSVPQTVTGLTNIAVTAGWATFQITTPATATVVSNYVPADAIVIPASATGNVQIILESSSDLLNWSAANPGTYSAASATNRFFRVRAVVN